jgi:nucleotide-binding universal stress UspA family protein
MEAQMTVTALKPTTEVSAGTAGPSSGKSLAVVVGFDGTPPARRALDQAAELLRGRDGALEVVYVSRLPGSAALSGVGVAEIVQGYDDQAVALAEEVRARLARLDHPWHFQHREGTVPAELVAVATDIHREYGDAATVVIVVGGSAHRFHRLVGSVGAGLIHQDRAPVIVVP